MACTQPDSVDANCNPTINLQTTTSDEWQYEGNGVYSLKENVTSYKYPDVTYRSCYREVTGAIKCFTFKAKVAGTSTPTNPSSPTCK